MCGILNVENQPGCKKKRLIPMNEQHKKKHNGGEILDHEKLRIFNGECLKKKV